MCMTALFLVIQGSQTTIYTRGHRKILHGGALRFRQNFGYELVTTHCLFRKEVYEISVLTAQYINTVQLNLNSKHAFTHMHVFCSSS